MGQTLRLQNVVHDDAPFEAVCGDKIGQGTTRVVCAHTMDPCLVLKVSVAEPHEANRMEWMIWKQVEAEPALTAVIGRCEAISASGRFLVMERLDDLSTDAQKAARRYPVWINDNKRSAFGVNASGNVKIRDYGEVTLGQTLAKAEILDILSDAQMDACIEMLRGHDGS